MIRRLRIRFILAATAVLLLVLASIISLVDILAYKQIHNQMYAIAYFITQNKGELPKTISSEGLYEAEEKENGQAGEENSKNPGQTPAPEKDSAASKYINAESYYENRYFSVALTDRLLPTKIYIEHTVSVNQDKALKAALNLVKNGSEKGIKKLGQQYYFYHLTKNPDGSYLVVCVDCTSRIWIVNSMFYYMWLIIPCILIIFVILFTLLSGKVVQPAIANAEKQKQFITNAGHELKTPLAVISANTEVMEMIHGSNQWTESNIRQIKRMSGLISELITLARLDERDDLVLESVDFSSLVRDAAAAFSSVASQQGKPFSLQVEDGITVKADNRGLQELTNILLDNAIKYCDEDGQVLVKLSKNSINKGVHLKISNTYAEGKSIDYHKFFERFYREDTSHNSKKSGYGIGLSMAKAIAERMKGKLSVSYSKDTISFHVNF